MAITQSAPLTGMPTTIRQALSSNYIDFATAGSSDGWAQQYLPDLIEKEAEVFGNRTISGFLSQVGAEEAMTSDQVVWSEQGRLHLAYTGHTEHVTVCGNTTGTPAGGQFTLDTDVDGTAIASGSVDHGVRVNDTVLAASATGVHQFIVTAVANNVIDVIPYDATNNNGQITNITGFSSTDTVVNILVYGSEYSKGTNGRGNSNDPKFKSFTNKPIILKDKYAVSGSDASAIGWVEVSGEDGQNGYMWYLKAEGDTRTRFADYCEMSMLEGVLGDSAQSAADGSVLNAAHTTFGTEGLFAALESRGNITDGVIGTSPSTDLAEFDLILAELDKQGAIEENMLFLNRATALAFDDMLAGAIVGFATGGASYGVFENGEDMALNLGFSGFRRGSYDFYKTDWKYLNQMDARAQINSINAAAAIRGVMIPAGVMSVYDQMLGKNMKRPFLHVRYRASQTDNRRFKSWVTGSVGAVTSDLDAMEVHYLSERCLVTQGANNFFLFKGGVAA